MVSLDNTEAPLFVFYIVLSGGTIYVTCPTRAPSGAFDADNGITLTGATVYVNGTQTTELGGGHF